MQYDHCTGRVSISLKKYKDPDSNRKIQEICFNTLKSTVYIKKSLTATFMCTFTWRVYTLQMHGHCYINFMCIKICTQ